MDSEHLAIGADEVGIRLDSLLARRFPEESRSYFQGLINRGLILVNGAIAKKSTSVALDDEIEVQFALTPEVNLSPEPIPLDIVFEDDYLIVLNKPAGLVVHPGAGNWSGTLVNGLLHYCRNLPDNDLRPGIVHRLDKETSGLLIAAKTERAQSRLVELFAARVVHKEYIAICCGKAHSQTVEGAIGRHPKDRKRMALNPLGKEAATELKVLSTNGQLSLVQALPKTGRTHQIRVHLESVGNPVLGDALYGWEHWNTKYNASRQLLHARGLMLSHPITGLPLTLEAPFPDDFQAYLKRFKPD